MSVLMARVVALAVLMGMQCTIGHAEEPLSVTSVQSDNLLRELIAGVDGKEVIVSRVSFPPRIELPWHWHPGEEFFYVIEGSVTLKRRGQPDIVTVRGDAQKIAPGVIHSGESGEEGAELVIFRVHASGEPERYLVE
jgi:quercetin dioxygenase-like cupin family protein